MPVCSTNGSIACRPTGTASSSRGRSSTRASRCGRRRSGRTGARFAAPRAADGLFPIDLPGPEALAELAGEIEALRAAAGAEAPFELVVENPAGTDPAPWIAAGATWCLTDFGSQPTRAEVEKAIDAHTRARDT